MAAPAAVQPTGRARTVEIRPQTHAHLMQQIGADSFDPVPPDQIRWATRQPGVNRLQQLHHYILECTMGFQPGRPRSPYAVNENGEPVNIQAIAARFGWDLANARWYLRELVLRGVVRMGTKQEGRSRIYLKGKVQPVDDLDKELKELKALNSVEARQKRYYFTSFAKLSPYLKGQIERLPEPAQDAIKTRLAEIAETERRLRIVVDEAKRTIIEQLEDITFEEFRIKKVRFTPKFKDPARAQEVEERNEIVREMVHALAAKLPPSLQSRLKLDDAATAESLPQTGESLQQTSPESLQQTSSKKVLENLFSRYSNTFSDDRSLLYSEKSQKGSPSSSSSSEEEPTTTTREEPVPDETASAVNVAMSQYEQADAEAVEAMVRRIRTAAPDATPFEMVTAIHMRGQKALRAKNPTGFLLSAVPKLFKGEQPWRAELAEQTRRADEARKAEEQRTWDAVLEMWQDPRNSDEDLDCYLRLYPQLAQIPRPAAPPPPSEMRARAAGGAL